MCNPLVDPLACVGEGAAEIVSKASNDAVQELTNQVLEGFGKVLATVGTVWVAVPTPVLTAGTGGAAPDSIPPRAASFTTILNYATYVGLILAVLSIVALGALIAVRSRRGDGMRHAGTLATIFVGVLLISGASAIVGALLKLRAPEGSSSAVGSCRIRSGITSALWRFCP